MEFRDWKSLEQFMPERINLLDQTNQDIVETLDREFIVFPHFGLMGMPENDNIRI